MDTPELILVCEGCSKPIAPGAGRLWIDYAHINRYRDDVRAWEKAHPKPDNGPRSTTIGQLRSYPDRVRWQAHHAACDPEPDAGAYVIDAERLLSWADLAHWTAHLMGLQWFPGTDWSKILEGVAEGAGTRLRPTVRSKLHA